jgi:hypothetical protein
VINLEYKKSNYNKPILKKIGSVKKITKGLTGDVSDGFGGNRPV